jgi:ribosomal protein S18 acetylase RimI-like enzyme
MTMQTRPAAEADIPTLVALMQSFYAEADFPLPAGPARRAFEALLASPLLGAAWLAEEGSEAVGHVVLTVSFSMEYGGLRGFIDDLYVRPAARGRGTGAALLAVAQADAMRRGVRALHVEVGPTNHVARRLYERAGYVDSGHLFLSLPLATPVHVA